MRAVSLALGWLLLAPGAQALVFFQTGDPAHNREAAPTGDLAGSGWQYQGHFKNFLGTMISPRHFVTAKHVGVGGAATTFVHKSFFSGSGGDTTYYVNPNVNGGTGFWNIPGTDLRVFEVYGSFPGYATLYDGTDEVGKQAVLMGRGRTRGAAITHNAETRGWLWGSNDKRARWGTNTVDSVYTGSSVGDLLVTDFDEAPGTEECHAALGDSGGALFLKDGAIWKLGGIIYAVDASYDTNAVCGDGTNFNGAMFNALDHFIGADNAGCNGWQAVSAGNDTDQSRAFISRVSSSAYAMQAIVQNAIDESALTSNQRYDEWMTSFGISPGTSPGDDEDMDGHPNVFEYLASLDPGELDHPKAVFKVEGNGDKIHFTVRVRLDAASRGLSWQIQQAETLINPDYSEVTGLTQVGVTRSLSEGVETLQLEVDKPAGSQMFYRLEVSLGP